MTRLGMTRLGCLILTSALILPFAGCKKGSTQLPDVSNRPTAAGGLGFVDPSAPAPNPGGQQPQPQPGKNIDGPLPVGKTMDKLEHSGLPSPHLMTASRGRLDQLGKGLVATALERNGPVNGPQDLGPDYGNKTLKDPLNRDYVVAWGVDFNNLPGNTLIAWEATGDSTGMRHVFQKTGGVQRISEDDFQKTPKAKK